MRDREAVEEVVEGGGRALCALMSFSHYLTWKTCLVPYYTFKILYPCGTPSTFSQKITYQKPIKPFKSHTQQLSRKSCNLFPLFKKEKEKKKDPFACKLETKPIAKHLANA